MCLPAQGHFGQGHFGYVPTFSKLCFRHKVRSASFLWVCCPTLIWVRMASWFAAHPHVSEDGDLVCPLRRAAARWLLYVARFPLASSRCAFFACPFVLSPPSFHCFCDLFCNPFLCVSCSCQLFAMFPPMPPVLLIPLWLLVVACVRVTHPDDRNGGYPSYPCRRFNS